MASVNGAFVTTALFRRNYQYLVHFWLTPDDASFTSINPKKSIAQA
ncbi:MAG TPA: hypothetical protein GX498_08700 [Clostridiales bacterium]|nr:hypothetical protein [Clostridiales bacterium]